MKVTIFSKSDLSPAKIVGFASLKEAKRAGYRIPKPFAVGDNYHTISDAPCSILEQVENTWIDENNGREHLNGLAFIEHKIDSGRVIISSPVGDIYFV